jgi:beta-carotene hydroxylase
LNHAESIAIARSHEPAIAWPTIALAFVVVIGFCAVGYFGASGALSLWLALPLNTLIAYAAYTPIHEACHRNVVDAKHPLAWLNNVVGTLAAAPLIGSFHLHQLTHLAHHAHTNNPERDPDHWMASRSLTSLVLRGLSIAWIHNAAGVRLARTRSDGRTRLLFAALQFATWLAAIAWLAWRFDAFAAILSTLVPALLAGLLLAIVFDWLPHHPHASQERWQHTRVVTFSPLTQSAVDLALLGQSYHLVHHLYPRVPFYQYRAVFRTLRGYFRENNALIAPFGARK